ncbi:hypothetical protein FB107DRAFT_214640, partial [Schizophyllum commune]
VPHAVQNWNIAVMGPGDLICPFVHLFTDGERPLCTHTSSIEFEECQASRGTGFQKKQFTADGCPAVVHICQGHTESHEFLIEFPSKIHALSEQSEAFILMYSVASRRSYNDVLHHLRPVICSTKPTPPPVIIVGVRPDGLDDVEVSLKREVTIEESKQMAKILGCPFFEIPAANQTHAQIMFTEIVREAREARAQYAGQRRQLPLVADLRSELRAHVTYHFHCCSDCKMNGDSPLCDPANCEPPLDLPGLDPPLPGGKLPPANGGCSSPPCISTGLAPVLSCTDIGSISSLPIITGDSGGVVSGDEGGVMLRLLRPAPLFAGSKTSMRMARPCAMTGTMVVHVKCGMTMGFCCHLRRLPCRRQCVRNVMAWSGTFLSDGKASRAQRRAPCDDGKWVSGKV